MSSPSGEMPAPQGTPFPAPQGPASPDEPVEPAPAARRPGWDPAVLAVVAAGGVLGAEARYGLGLALPHRPGQWPLSTWLVNVSGCFLIGVLMVVVTELTSAHRLVRPFLGTGVLGGYTTFSTATVDVQLLAQHGRPALALGYLLVTVVTALVAVTVGTVATRGVVAAGGRAGTGHR